MCIPSDTHTAESRRYRLAAVGLVLLCVLLLLTITLLCIRLNNLTGERNQLQASYTSMTADRDQLQTNYTNMTSWTESRDNCRQRGADLVIINSKEEQRDRKERVWIGLNKSEGVWKWVDGSELITGFWYSGEPSNYRDDCVITGYVSDTNKNWFQYSCSTPYFGICERSIFN
uniref:C-type lectin domain-containing protein n=1 Tax=Astyanax mexicanus TaxID=7994 RepID=A0A3B1IP67_ASTMX